MATRQGALIPDIKIPGTIEDRAVLSALESIQSAFETWASRPVLHHQKIPFTSDVHSLAVTVVYRPSTNVELTDAAFVPSVSATAGLTISLVKLDANGENMLSVGVIEGRTSGFTPWVAGKPKTFAIAGPRKLIAGQQHALTITPNGVVATFTGTLALTYREVL